MNVTFSLPNIGKGVVTTKWKESTLFLPSKIKTFPSKDFSRFTVEFLGNKIDHGELPHNIFQEEDGIRDRSPSRGLGDVYKRQIKCIRNVRFGLHCMFFTFCGFIKGHKGHICINYG